MKLRIAGGVLASVVICVGGCGSNVGAPLEPIGQSANTIQGGTTDTTHTFAIGICGGSDGNPDGGQNCQVLCSGALIAPNLIISARHCVDNVSSDTVDCSSDTFGSLLFPADQYYITTDQDMFDPGAHWIQVSQIVTPTPTSFCGNDLSLLILSSNVPTSEASIFATPEIWYPIDSPRYSSTETAIGYGLDSPTDENSAGVRRILQNINIECVPDDPVTSQACAPVAESGIAENEFEAGNGPCEGDSGSSAYEQDAFNSGTFLSLGVLSRGGSSGNLCIGSVYTQLYPWQSLILSTAAEAATMGGYSAPAWTVEPSGGGDGGSPSGDSGAHLDGATTTDGGKLPLGATCSASGLCGSNQCVELGDAGYVCSKMCTTGDPCPTGFDCSMGYCFAGSGSGTESSNGGSGGCSLAKLGAREQDDSRGLDWLLALGLGVLLVRKRRE
jgi:hypothetical protein